MRSSRVCRGGGVSVGGVDFTCFVRGTLCMAKTTPWGSADHAALWTQSCARSRGSRPTIELRESMLRCRRHRQPDPPCRQPSRPSGGSCDGRPKTAAAAARLRLQTMAEPRVQPQALHVPAGQRGSHCRGRSLSVSIIDLKYGSRQAKLLSKTIVCRAESPDVEAAGSACIASAESCTQWR